MQIKSVGFLLSAVATAALVACGGGGSVTLSGEVIDGYIAGATVCLDENADGACTANEPRSITGDDGKFTLSVDPNIDGKFILVQIPDSAKDSDDGGLTLAQAGKAAYVMATPASQPQVVTPLTTLLVGKVKSDGLSMAEARTRVLDELGLPAETDLHADHVEAGNVQVHAMARQVAARLQEAKREVGVGGGANVLASIGAKLKEQNDILGQLVTDEPTPLTNIPEPLASLADGKLLLHRMISATGKPIVASAMLFTPKTAAPAGGRPLIVLGSGTTGIAGKCAPSNLMQGNFGFGYASLVAQMIGNGFAVVVPDYEGRGPSSVQGIPDAHPYLHVGSAGNSMVLAAVAAKRLLGSDLSGAWAAWGHSQGGHAALAAAQFASLGDRLEPSLDYRGAIAVAPASHFQQSVQRLIGLAGASENPLEAFGYLGTLGFYASYIVQGSKFTASPIDPEAVLGAQMQPVHQSAGADCLDTYYDKVEGAVGAFAQTGGKPGDFGAVNVAAISSDKVSAVLRSLEPGRVKLPGKTLLVQGSADSTVLPATTQALEQVMLGKGSEVSLTLVEDAGADHSGVLGTLQAQQAMQAHLAQIFGLVQ